jgi:hypothetical protein
LTADVAVVDQSIRTISLREGQQEWPQYRSYISFKDYYEVTSTAFYISLFQMLSVFSAGRSALLAFPESFTGGFIQTSPSDPTIDPPEDIIAFNLLFLARGYQSVEQTEVVIAAETEKSQSDTNATRRVVAKLEPSEAMLGFESCQLWEDASARRRCYNNEVSGRVPVEMTFSVSGPEPFLVATPLIVITLALCLKEERKTSELQLKAGEKLRNLPDGGVFTPGSLFYRSPVVFDRLRAAGIDFKTLTVSNEELTEDLLFPLKENVVTLSAEPTLGELTRSSLDSSSHNNNNNNNNCCNSSSSGSEKHPGGVAVALGRDPCAAMPHSHHPSATAAVATNQR